MLASVKAFALSVIIFTASTNFQKHNYTTAWKKQVHVIKWMDIKIPTCIIMGELGCYFYDEYNQGHYYKEKAYTAIFQSPDKK